MTSEIPAAIAFDAIANEYDARFTETVVGRAQRDSVWEVIDRVFTPGQRVLEVNCGTGVDAAHLASRGVRVHACDASSVMIDVARRRAGQHGIEVPFEVRAIEQLGGLSGRFDGVFSNFGGLNCVHDLNRFVCDLDRLVKVGGNVVCCYMGPFCAWETAWFLLHGQPRKAVRRWTRRDVVARVGDGPEFRIHYPSVSDLRFAFLPQFRLREWKAIGVCVPPSYVEQFAATHPRAMRLATRLDRRINSLPVFRGIADHVLLRFEKVAG